MAAAGAVPIGLTGDQFLRRMYAEVAATLERLGRIVEAAFVHADLLANAWDAVLVLERHGEFALAA
jgi:hypothetical protein